MQNLFLVLYGNEVNDWTPNKCKEFMQIKQHKT